jgi:hypothetical protein
MPKKQTTPPYPFVQEALLPLEPEYRRSFGAHTVYINDKIVLWLRDNIKAPEDNGLWLVLSEQTNPKDKSLKKDFPSLRKIALLGEVIHHWLLIPSDSPHFEEEALHACDLLLARDPRIGRIPKSRQKKPKPQQIRKI